MKYLRVVVAFLLLPVAAAVAWSFGDLLIKLGAYVSTASLPFWLGLASYFLFQIVFFRPVRTYVFGHELTHALVGVLSGARLKSFKVTSSGGSVVLTKNTLWIALAPYFVPVYTLLLVGAYRIGCRVWPLDAYYPYFLFAAGFSLSFHFALTHFAVAQGQSDLKQFGTFFSGVVIVLISCPLMAGLLKLIFPQFVSCKGFLYGAYHDAVLIFRVVFNKGYQLCIFFRSMK
jgi:hypothetical protein